MIIVAVVLNGSEAISLQVYGKIKKMQNITRRGIILTGSIPEVLNHDDNQTTK